MLPRQELGFQSCRGTKILHGGSQWPKVNKNKKQSLSEWIKKKEGGGNPCAVCKRGKKKTQTRQHWKWKSGLCYSRVHTEVNTSRPPNHLLRTRTPMRTNPQRTLILGLATPWPMDFLGTAYFIQLDVGSVFLPTKLVCFFFPKKYLLIYLAAPGLSRDMWDLNSLTRNRTCVPLYWEHGVLATGPAGKLFSG